MKRWVVRIGVIVLALLIMSIIFQLSKRQLFLFACLNNHLSLARALLSTDNQLSKEQFNSTSLLYLSARKEKYALLDLLLSRGADINRIETSTKQSVLHLAVQGRMLKLIHYLLNKGAAVNVINVSGETPIFIAVESGDLTTTRILLASNANINAQDNTGFTPLHYSVLFSDTKMVKLLLLYNADATVRDRKGNTPIDYAYNSKYCYLLLKKYLRDNAKQNILHSSGMDSRRP